MRETSPTAVILDTDVVSYLFRGDTRAELFRPSIEQETAIVSFMTVAELDRWALHRNWGTERRQRLNEFVSRFSVITVDRNLCQTWADVMDQARRVGRPIQVADAWIAATAIALDVPLVTNNRSDFTGVNGITLLP